MNHSGPKKSSLIFEGLNDVSIITSEFIAWECFCFLQFFHCLQETNHGGNGLIHRLWNYPFSGANSSSKRPISMDFSDMYNHHTHHPDPCYAQGVHNHRHVHQTQHHSYHQQLPQPQQHHHHCLQNSLHISDVWFYKYKFVFIQFVSSFFTVVISLSSVRQKNFHVVPHGGVIWN